MRRLRTMAWLGAAAVCLGASLGCSSTTGSGGGGNGGSSSGSGGSSGSSGSSSGTASSSSSGSGGGSGGSSGGDSSGSGSGSGSGSSGGSSGSSSGNGSGGDGGIDCTIPSLSGVPAQTSKMIAQPFPTGAAMGGTIVSGTYYATEEDIYQGGTVSQSTKTVLVFDASNTSLREADDGGNGGTTQGFVATYATSGSAFTLTGACGATKGAMGEYMATATTFVVYDSQKDRVTTFTKQ